MSTIKSKEDLLYVVQPDDLVPILSDALVTGKSVTPQQLIDSATITKADVGLSNVDNTSDLNKPVSTLQQTALNLKADITYVDDNYVPLISTEPMSAIVPAYALKTTGDFYNNDSGFQLLSILDANDKGFKISNESGLFNNPRLVLEAVGFNGIFDSMLFRAGGSAGQILFELDGVARQCGIGAGGSFISTTAEIAFGVNAGASSVLNITSGSVLGNGSQTIGNAVSKFTNGYFSGDVSAATFNSISLTTGGSATNFLNEQGNYVTVPLGAVQLSDLTDVNTSTPTNRNVLVADGTDWESRALVKADISDFGSYLPLTGGTVTGNISIQSVAPRYMWWETDAALDEKRWDILTTGGNLEFRVISDDGLTGNTYMKVTRTGITPDLINFNVPVQLTGISASLKVGNGSTGDSSYITIGKGFDVTSGINWNRSGNVDCSIEVDAAENLVFSIDKTNVLGSNAFYFDANGSTVATIFDTGAVTAGNFNGVALTTAGSATQFLAGDGNYQTLTESDISDLGTYLTSEVNDLTASVTWANVPDTNITQSSVTQHQAALSITESQISDFGSYLPLTGKAADSDKLDNLDSTQFLRSDVADSSEATLQFRQAMVLTNGVPTGQLGTPSIVEMGLFEEQFNNKTAFYDETLLTIETSPDNSVWTPLSISTVNLQKFLGGDASAASIVIPNGTNYFRITLVNDGNYVFLNALYMYISGGGNPTAISVWEQDSVSKIWNQLTSRTETAGNSAPSHFYVPFPTVLHNLNSANPTHSDAIRFVFTPTWNNANNILLYRMQIWGGYPVGKRRIYDIDYLKNVTFPAKVTATDNVRVNATLPINDADLTRKDYVDGQINNQTHDASDIVSGTIEPNRIHYIDILDTRSIDEQPEDVELITGFDFKQKATLPGLITTSGYVATLTGSQWSDASGGKAYQFAIDGKRLHVREGDCGAVSWDSGWAEFWSTDNFDPTDYLRLDGTTTMTGAIDTTVGTFTSSVGTAGDAFSFDTANNISTGSLLSLNNLGIEKVRFSINNITKNYARIELPDNETTPNNFYFGYSDLDLQYAGMFNDFGDFWLGINSDQTTYINYYNGANVSFGSGTNQQTITMNTNSNGLRIVNPNNETLTINGSGTGDLQFGASVLANNFIFSHNIDSPSFNGVALTDAGSANLFLNEQGDYVTPGGGGNVSNTGTPVNNQLAVWTDTTTIEGDANLTFDTSTDTLDTVNITATNINLTGSTTLFQATLTDGTSLSTAIRGVASTGVNSRSGVSGDCVTSNSWGGIFSNSSDTYTTTCSLGGGTRIARFSYFSDSVEITKTGGITATGAITADSINTDDIVESTTDAGVTIEGLLLKDNTLSYSGSTQAVINISNDTGTSGQATAIIGTTAPTGQAIRATANGVNNVAGIFSNSSGTFTSSCSLGKGGTNMATFSYFTSSVNINTSGGITSTKGIDKLTHASGSVDVSAASAPTTGQVLTATSGTAATWQTPAVGKVVYAGSIVAAGAVISMANGQTGWSVSKTATGQYLVTHPLGTNNMTIIITSYTLNTTVAHNTPNSSNFTIYIRSVSTLGAVDAAVDFMVINKD